ncbi:MAG: aminopeptidase P N-terminal domain-containing protein, partial [Clostridiales bacterium]|nr:aminopeptidase P N-terminal domain-containing protein [Clostridiales bacterium]
FDIMSFFTVNREKLINKLNDNEMVILFSGKAPKSTADALYRFKPNKNFFYFTGLTKENFSMTILKTKDKVETKLFVEEPNYDVEKWYGRKMTKEMVTKTSGIDKVEYEKDFLPYLNKSILEENAQVVYFDLEKLYWDEPHTYSHKFALGFKEKYLHVNIKTVHNIVSEFRMIKDEYEIDQIRSAITLTKLGIDEIMINLKPGMYEYQAESVFNYTITNNGADGNAFDTIAASGENAVILHHIGNDSKVKKDSLILMDLGAQYNQYASDISRTLPVSGKYTERQKQLYNIVLNTQKEVIKIMIPGTPFSKMNEVAKEFFAKELISIGLIQNEDEVSKYYYHGVGHYMGLDTHDLGSREVDLKPGMVITCEPGLYIAEEKIGIRIEDDILITEEGNEVLSKSIIKEVDDIEKFMSNR